VSDPVIDPRTGEDVVDQAQALRAAYTPEWTATSDSASALISIFGRLMEIMISRLNRVPEKNFLAFLDTAGVRLLAPKAARAPIKFVASAGAKKDAVVPAGTQVASVPPPGRQPLTFETEKGLTVSRARLAYLYSHDPGSDRYTDQHVFVTLNDKNDTIPIQPFAGSLLIPHRLYLSQDIVLQIGARAKVTLVFRVESATTAVVDLFGTGLQWQIRSGENDVRPVSAVSSVVETNRIKVVLDDPSLNLIGATKVGGIDGHWIEAETRTPLSREAAKLKVMSVTVASEAADIKPSMAFFNATPLDPHREYYPFGERPKKFDAFVVAIPEALTKPGSTIKLSPSYAPGTAGTAGVDLSYEFWDGSRWQTLGVAKSSSDGEDSGHAFEDTTHAFTIDPAAATGDLHISFTCPAMQPVDVNGKTSYWLRARITAGDYGTDAKLALRDPEHPPSPATLADYVYKEATFNPPIITSLTASYRYAAGQDVTAVKTENNFALASADASEFQPFATSQETEPACYLGLDAPFAPNGISLYVAVEETLLTIAPRVVWEYWDGTQWKNLGVQDGTSNFTQSGIVEFIGPGDDAAKVVLFGQDAYWLRSRLEQGDESLTWLLGVYLNTVWATNAVTLTAELIGSSTETPNAAFTLARFPVLDGLQLEVREPERPSDEDLTVLFAEEGVDAVTPVQEGEGAVREAWVRWHRVDHFRFSSKKSRHYIADWFNGRVQFGDGVRGMVPPAGRGNIRATRYQAGGGAAGNVARNTITELKRAIPFVDKAFNVDAAGGGSDGETIDHVKERGPQTIKNRNRAVTWEDFEWLAREASFQVARARCLPAQSKSDAGTIRLILVPQSDDMKPYPSQGLINQVKDYVSPRARRLATADLKIAGPKYVEISIATNIVPVRMEEADLVRRRVKSALTVFFHPLHGGPDRRGWEFGRDVFVSEVSKVIEDTEGVNHAESVEICSSFYDDGRAAIAMPADHNLMSLIYQVDIGDEYLVASGNHLVAINGVGEANADPPFLGNPATREFHNLRNQQTNCRIPAIVRSGHARPFSCLGDPIRERYDFCAYCFGRGMSLR
jgi:uncharacterized phage protein gp47/JayE